MTRHFTAHWHDKAARRAAGYYLRSTGHLPPELRADDQRADKAPAPTT